MLHYQTHGSPARPALCFLHGFMGSSADWQPVVQALAQDAYCLTVDLPGHGRSVDEPCHFYTMEGATQALADVLDDAGVERCTLVGYSMGGRVALYFSVYHAHRVRRLGLESASPGLRTDDERARRRAIDEERAHRIEDDLGAFLENWYQKSLFASLAQHDLVEEMVTRRKANDSSELARALRGLGPGHQPSLWGKLGELSMPTLVLTGTLDEKYQRVTEETVQRIPDARRVVVPRAGHNVHAERPQAFLSHLVQFLTNT